MIKRGYMKFDRRVRRFVNRLRSTMTGVAPNVCVDPIFLLGHPKSGTTAIAALLSRATGLPVTMDAFNTFGISRTEASDLIKGRTSMSDFVRDHPYAFATPLNKCPKLTFVFDALRAHFSGARFVLIVRDPRDTVRSFLVRRSVPGDLAWLQSTPSFLPDLPGANYVERLSHRWNVAADVALDNPDEVVLIRYEDFVLDKPAEIDRLAYRLGLVARYDIRAWADQPFKPRSRIESSWVGFFGEANLHRINAICGERMHDLDYDIPELSNAARS